MNVTVVLDHKFYKAPDQTIWTEVTMPYSFWTRYLSVFDRVRVIGRLEHIEKVPSRWRRADGPGVEVCGVTTYTGPYQYVARVHRIHRELRNFLSHDEAFVLRLPSTLGLHAARILSARRWPFAIEVVGDPFEVFAPGAIRHPLRPVFRYWFTWQLKKVCSSAKAIAYVTEKALQRRYPPAPHAYTTYYSSIELPVDSFVSGPRTTFPATGQVLVAVGSLAQLYKGPDVLLKSVNLLLKYGLDVRLVWVGGGRYLGDMKRLAYNLGLENRVRFTGPLRPEDVREELDGAHLFVLPSRAEGLPRAIIEAMARGLPCVATTVGGIPELLDNSCLVPPNDPFALAQKIRELLSNPKRLAELSAKNLVKAQEYREDLLRQRRDEFYKRVEELTSATKCR